MKYIIYSLTLYSIVAWFILLRGLGLHQSPAMSNYYIIFVFILDLLSIAYSIYDIVKKKRVSNAHIFAFFLTIVFTLLIPQPQDNYLIKMFLAFGIAPMFIAADIVTNHSIAQLVKWVKLLSQIFAIIIVLSLDTIILGGFGDNDYSQSLSYFSGISFGLILYTYLFPSQETDFSFYKYKLFRYFMLGQMFMLVIIALISGGRGGTLLVIISAIIAFSFYIKSNRDTFRKNIYKVFIPIVLVCVLYNFLPTSITDLISKGSERTFSYISRDGIDMTETSDRDLVYSDAISMIKESQLSGHGIYRYYDKFHNYPHNFFLEVLMQGGIIYLMLWSIVLCYIFYKWFAVLRNSESNKFVLMMTLYPIVFLMFSSTYMSVSLFWFLLVYFLFQKYESIN